DVDGCDRLKDLVARLDPEAKLFCARQFDKSGERSELDEFMGDAKYGRIQGFHYPIDKFGIGDEDWEERGIPQWKDGQIPVARADIKSEEYQLWRTLARKMGDRVYRKL